MRKGTRHVKDYRGTPLERFWKFVEKTDYCWNWTGATVSKGYGVLRVNGKNERTHRYSYIIHNGTIPKGAGYHGTCVLHKCDNPKCVNPEHLSLGNNSDNVNDMVSKMRNTIGERNGMAKLKIKDVIEIRKLKKQGYSLSKLSSKFKIAISTVSQIINKKRWKKF